MSSGEVDLDALPVRFNPPDEWRVPDAVWVSLHQGFIPPHDWQPYESAPAIPPEWPWWEENGTSWYRFFRAQAPSPARGVGNWFALGALGLFAVVLSPFTLPPETLGLGGAVGVIFLVFGIRGVIRTLRTQGAAPSDALATIREWSRERRETYFRKEYALFRSRDPRELTLDEFMTIRTATWWGENSASEES